MKAAAFVTQTKATHPVIHTLRKFSSVRRAKISDNPATSESSNDATEAVQAAIRTLRKFSFVKHDVISNVLAVHHRLVQKVIHEEYGQAASVKEHSFNNELDQAEAKAVGRCEQNLGIIG